MAGPGIGNYVSVLPSSGPAVSVKTGFDQSLPVAGTQRGLSVVTLQSLTVPSGATTALIQVVGANVFWQDDGTSPTASAGFILYAGQAPQVFAGNLAALKFISAGGAAATITVAYYQ